MTTELRTSGILMGSSAMDVGGSAPSYPARAWIRFNGTNNSIAISANVSSLTDNGVGDFFLNFSTAMGTTDYTCVGSAGTTAAVRFAGPVGFESSRVRVETNQQSGSNNDYEISCFVVFMSQRNIYGKQTCHF